MALKLVGNAVGTADDHHPDALLYRVHLWLVARRYSGRERATDSADHCDHAAARQRHSSHRGAVRFHAAVRSRNVARIETTVPHLVMWVAAILGLASLMAFLFLIDYAARLLRPVSILWRVGEEGLAVIESVYPKPIRDTDPLPVRHAQLGASDRIVSHRGTSAIVLAVNLEALVAEANRADGVIEVVPRVGDFVAVGEPVFLLHGGSGAFDEHKLRGSIAFGPERTIEQNSTFAFRVIVDIAIKALSKAINDPTTAVLAIDQLHRLLRTVGGRHLHNEQIMDDAGRLRVIFPTPNWDDFVQLAFREIRLYGAENFQIARRLRAMLDNLMKTLPESRRLFVWNSTYSIAPSRNFILSRRIWRWLALRTRRGLADHRVPPKGMI